MRIVVAGAGLAGLSACRLLRAQGHEVHLVEQIGQFGRRGYGIALWEEGWQVLRQLGVADAVARNAVAVNRWEIRDQTGRVLDVLGARSGQHATAPPSFSVVHRADLHEALRAGLPRCAFTMGASVQAVSQGAEGVTVTLDDGGSRRADLLVGADGVRSQVREQVFGASSRDLGSAAWAFWAPERVDVPDGFTELWGRDGKALLIGGVAGKRMATLSMPVPPGDDVRDPLAYLRARADEWVLPELLDAVGATGGDVFFDRIRAVELRQFHRGRIVLLGDAAHAVHPIVGQGAALALRDASVLAERLPPETRDPAAALEEFTRERRGPVRRTRVEAGLARRLVLTRSGAVAAMRDFLAARTPLFGWFFARQAAQLPGSTHAR